MEENQIKRKSEPILNPYKKVKQLNDKPIDGSPILVILPGASGNLCKSTKAFFETMPNEIITSEIKWNIFDPSHQSNIDKIESLISNVNSPFFIIGNSFSNRVLCKHLCHLESTNLKGVIFLGYPLIGPNGKYREEYKELKLVRKSLQLLFISGSNDEFINRNGNGKVGLNSIKSWLELEDGQVKYIKGGKHGVPDCRKKADKLEAEANLKRWINEFII
jgi:hypothetical protein